MSDKTKQHIVILRITEAEREQTVEEIRARRIENRRRALQDLEPIPREEDLFRAVGPYEGTARQAVEQAYGEVLLLGRSAGVEIETCTAVSAVPRTSRSDIWNMMGIRGYREGMVTKLVQDNPFDTWDSKHSWIEEPGLVEIPLEDVSEGDVVLDGSFQPLDFDEWKGMAFYYEENVPNVLKDPQTLEDLLGWMRVWSKKQINKQSAMAG